MRRACLAALAAALFFTVASSREASAESASVPGQERVTNGVLSQERPTTGALVTNSGMTTHHILCSGTLIGCRTFLTAAHCVCNDSGTCGTPVPSEYSVFLQDVGIVGVSAIDVDPTFSFGTRGDVAVLTLSSPVTGVAPMPINTLMRPPFGTAVEIAGYGLTRGGADDTGMLRSGSAETSACSAADGDFHVCWAFTSPLGAPGLDSNTCNGDSGGPLFADLGSGTAVVGITSGGTSADCLPTDESYDTDVYVHRAFIQGVGGADLANTSCGTIAQVGQPGADRWTFDFDSFGRSQQACRKELSRQYNGYVTGTLRAWRSCLDGVAGGSRTAPCPDAAALAELGKVAAKVSLDKLLQRCPDDVAPTIQAAGACAGAATAADLAACLVSASDTAAAAALDREYADDQPAGVIGDVAARDCQQAVGAASAALFKATLKNVIRCQVSLAAGKVAACPDQKTSDGLARAEAKAGERILDGCTSDAVALLDGSGTFGGSCAGVTTREALAACEIADHAAIRGDLLALVADQAMEADVSFVVPPGAATLRATLNGRDSGANDLDLYLRFGAPASVSVHDAKSENGGMFEETEIPSPAAGTWYAHIARYSGDTLIPYQLSATAFQP